MRASPHQALSNTSPIVAALLASVLLLAPRGVSAQPPNQVGAWAAPFSMVVPAPASQQQMNESRFNDVPVNAAVLRSGVSDAKLVYWGSSYAFFQGIYQSSTQSLQSISRISKPINGSGNASTEELFCAGQTVMPDGRILIAGGHHRIVTDPSAPGYPGPATGYDRWLDTYDIGPRHAYAFDPAPSDNTRWVKLNDMTQPRYYPTCTTLDDGRVLVTSGNMGQYLVQIGGEATAGGSPLSNLHVISDTDRYEQIVPTVDGAAPALKEHTSVYDGPLSGQDYNRLRIVTFGGVGLSGATQVLKNDVWTLFRRDNVNAQNVAHRWAWGAVTPLDSAGVNVNLPSGRALHSACRERTRRNYIGTLQWNPTAHGTYGDYVTTGAFNGEAYTGSMLVFGGYTGSVAAKVPSDELWVFSYDKLSSGAPPNVSRSGYWNNLTIAHNTTNWPSPRYGHSAAILTRNMTMPGMNHALPGALIVYGGREIVASQERTITEGDYVWVYYPEKTPAVWEKLPVAPDVTQPSGAQTPGAREGAAMVFKPSLTQNDLPCVYMFGGRRSRVTPGEYEYFNDLWKLRFSFASDGVNLASLAWEKVNIPSPPITPRHQVALTIDDVQHKQLVVSGGEGPTSGSIATASGLMKHSDVFRHVPTGSTPEEWRVIPATSIGSPVARSGHTLVLDPRLTHARKHEIFNPQTGLWDTLTSSGLNDLWMEQYPSIFQLPDRRLFYAGPTKLTRTFSWTNGWSDAGGLTTSSHLYSQGFGSTAAMYRPGIIMKCGDGTNQPSGLRVDRIDFTPKPQGALGPASGQWESLPDLSETRFHHNLTILPNGNVLLTGGDAGGTTMEDMGGSLAPRQSTLLWMPDQNGLWTTLASDPQQRKYHSVALLLPDARVLTAGGFGKTDPLAHTGAVFTPPYLYKSNGNPVTDAERPQVVSVTPPTIDFSRSCFDVTLANSDPISSVCLIRASAVTHNNNMDQRYVPLAFKQTGASLQVSKVATFRNSWKDLVSYRIGDFGGSQSGRSVAPPGDYMLFVVRASDGVPSIARWVTIAGSNSVPVPPTDTATPAQSTLNVSATWGANCQRVTKFTWTNTGDDGWCDLATTVQIRKSVTPITDANFASRSVVANVPANGPGSSQSYSDTATPLQTTMYFAVRIVDEAGNVSPVATKTFTYVGQCTGLGSTEEEIPKTLTLQPPTPTPSRESATIMFGVPRELVGQRCELSVYDASGRRVRQLMTGPAGEGWQWARWDLRTDGGGFARSGVYFARLQIGAQKTTTRVIVTN